MTHSDRTCGSCSLCCKVLRVDELHKPMGQWCAHFKAGVGHGRAENPQALEATTGLWVRAMDRAADAVRPDRCKVVMTIDDGGHRIIARADPADPTAWRREPIHGQLRRWAADFWFKGRTIWAMVGTRMWLVTPDRDVDIGETDERCPTAYQQAPDGTITVIVLPPLPEGEAYDSVAVQAAVDAGEGRRVVSRA